ncbi:MAG: mismatch repair protein MutT [Mycobacterium sp.]|nr:mismatch repair protein MutT [Mycobacterium sp.]
MKRSAGLLLWRRGASGALEVLLAHPGGPFFVRKDDAHWSIPKGEIDPGEDEWRAARREFSEELGIPVPDGEPVSLGEQSQGRDKINVIWALEADPGPFEVNSNLFDLEWPPRSGKTAQFPEVDRVAWYDLDTARIKLFGSQRPFIDRLEAIVTR